MNPRPAPSFTTAVTFCESWLIQLSASAVSVTDSQLPPLAGASTVHECSAGDSSTLPAASLARTRNTWSPTPRFEYSIGEVHAANDPPSSMHSKVAPASSDEKSNVALVSVVVAAGRADPSIVSGSIRSAGGVDPVGVPPIWITSCGFFLAPPPPG